MTEIDEYVETYKKILEALEREGIRHPTAPDAILQEVAKDKRMERMHGGEERTADDPVGYVYIYVPDGLRDRDFEALLKERIPKSETPREDNVFWSNKYGNFVVKKEYAEQVESAIEEHYGKGSLVKDPSWAQKPNTWQIKSARSK